VSAEEGDLAHFAFTHAHFVRLTNLHPLYDATDTDLAPFQRNGGKLILWHGWSDPHISPINSIAFYSAVQKQLGKQSADTFVRLFLFPGMYHCGGGDGFSQFDVLRPLMSWVEGGSAPEKIIAAQVPAVPMMMGPLPNAAPEGPRGGRGDAPQLGAAGAPASRAPLPRPDAKALRTRPVFPYPLLAQYTGHGSPDDAENYTSVPSPIGQTASYAWEGAGFYAPDMLKQYAVSDGKLVVTGGSIH
jgi:feruloyl esterase